MIGPPSGRLPTDIVGVEHDREIFVLAPVFECLRLRSRSRPGGRPCGYVMLVQKSLGFHHWARSATTVFS